MHPTELELAIRKILAAHAGLTTNAADLAANDDLFAAGMKSASVVNVMMAVEERFDFEAPEDRLTRATFSSIAAIADLVRHFGAAA